LFLEWILSDLPSRDSHSSSIDPMQEIVAPHIGPFFHAHIPSKLVKFVMGLFTSSVLFSLTWG